MNVRRRSVAIMNAQLWLSLFPYDLLRRMHENGGRPSTGRVTTHGILSRPTKGQMLAVLPKWTNNQGGGNMSDSGIRQARGRGGGSGSKPALLSRMTETATRPAPAALAPSLSDRMQQD